MRDAEGEARRALNRLRRALEKGQKELDALSTSLRRAEAEDFPTGSYETAEAHIGHVIEFVDEEARRLQEKILHAGGLEPGRVRRSSATGG